MISWVISPLNGVLSGMNLNLLLRGQHPGTAAFRRRAFRTQNRPRPVTCDVPVRSE